MCTENYFEGQRIRIEKLFSKKHFQFGSASNLANWYIDNLKNNGCQCYYCETSIHDINKLIDAGVLKQRKIGYGYRGKVLEIDKNDDSYIMENCVLSCYYCNNDKSYILDKENYKKHFGNNRKEYFKTLLQQL